MTREEFINHGFHKDKIVWIESRLGKRKAFVKGVDFGSNKVLCELTTGIEINAISENVELTEK
ncbi:hypothetical protein Barb6XT_03124 [Bacteroidales bacterium Barb6XT]|nr:hypothetical protein Barb6XT_03124 [Bacteroidales bacterium Barb6XT]